MKLNLFFFLHKPLHRIPTYHQFLKSFFLKKLVENREANMNILLNINIKKLFLTNNTNKFNLDFIIMETHPEQRIKEFPLKRF